MPVHSVRPAEQRAKKKAGRRRHVGHSVEHVGKGGFVVHHNYQDAEGGYSPSKPEDKQAFEDGKGMLAHLQTMYGGKGGGAAADDGDGDEG